jgi:hypothetical protein
MTISQPLSATRLQTMAWQGFNTRERIAQPGVDITHGFGVSERALQAPIRRRHHTSGVDGMSGIDHAGYEDGDEVRLTTSGPVAKWRLRRTETGLRLGQLRALGSERFTWADLLRVPLAAVRVYVLYFPSRFNLPVDAAATEALRVFGPATSEQTSVDFWDPQDVHFSDALELFGLRSPPALVMVAGLQAQVAEAVGTDILPDSLYCISFSDEAVLSDRQRMAAAVNIAHEILMRCDNREIARYIRGQKIKELLAAIGHGAGAVRDELIKLRPKFGLPGGLSVGVG